MIRVRKCCIDMYVPEGIFIFAIHVEKGKGVSGVHAHARHEHENVHRV